MIIQAVNLLEEILVFYLGLPLSFLYLLHFLLFLVFLSLKDIHLLLLLKLFLVQQFHFPFENFFSCLLFGLHDLGFLGGGQLFSETWSCAEAAAT